jgi:tetratricopeptide (TPR) repeat protein
MKSFSFVAALSIYFLAQTAAAQLVGSRTVEARGCATAVGGDIRDSAVTVVCGMPPEQVVELVRLAASPLAGDRTELSVRLSGLVPASSQLRIEAIIKFFQLLGEVPVEENRLADRFAQIASEHRQLIEEVRTLRVSDPAVGMLRQQAEAALTIADHGTARAKLAEARAIVRSKREKLERVLEDQQREEASLAFAQAGVEYARFAYDQAAQLFAEAAGLLPPGDIETRWRYIMAKAGAELAMGDEFGKNSALIQAAETYRGVLPLVPRSERQLDWARTQNNLGSALRTLGARESGTARLEEAVSACREALKEWTRERVPLDWAEAQNNLANALGTLGERESGTARLEEAVSAYREVLKEWTRERVPLQTPAGVRRGRGALASPSNSDSRSRPLRIGRVATEIDHEQILQTVCKRAVGALLRFTVSV